MNAVEAGRVDVFAGTALTTREVVKKSRKTESTEPFAPLVDGKPHVGRRRLRVPPDGDTAAGRLQRGAQEAEGER